MLSRDMSFFFPGTFYSSPQLPKNFTEQMAFLKHLAPLSCSKDDINVPLFFMTS